MRAMRVAACARRGWRVHLQLRMYVLRDLRQRAQWDLSQLQWRACPPAATQSQQGRHRYRGRGLTGALDRGDNPSVVQWRHERRQGSDRFAPTTSRRNVLQNDPIVIVGAARTPMGGFQGDFATLAASDLGAVAIKAAVERAGIKAADVEELIFGNCLMAGQGQAPARQASIKAGLPLSTNCTTLSKMCGSAMKAAMLAHDSIIAGSADIVVAGGMESMSNAPFLLPKARAGMRMGHGTVLDHMFF